MSQRRAIQNSVLDSLTSFMYFISGQRLRGSLHMSLHSGIRHVSVESSRRIEGCDVYSQPHSAMHDEVAKSGKN